MTAGGKGMTRGRPQERFEMAVEISEAIEVREGVDRETVETVQNMGSY